MSEHLKLRLRVQDEVTPLLAMLPAGVSLADAFQSLDELIEFVPIDAEAGVADRAGDVWVMAKPTDKLISFWAKAIARAQSAPIDSGELTSFSLKTDENSNVQGLRTAGQKSSAITHSDALIRYLNRPIPWRVRMIALVPQAFRPSRWFRL